MMFKKRTDFFDIQMFHVVQIDDRVRLPMDTP